MNQADTFKARTLELDSKNDYCIIGDVHACLDELKELITDNKGWVIDEHDNMLNYNPINKRGSFFFKFILVGDYLDKGPQISDTIKFLYKNKEHFIIVRGNHENFVYNYLKGKRGDYNSNNNKTLIEGYFNSVLVLEKFEDLKQMFFELFESSYDFVIEDRFIVTHSPCHPKYLGKTDKKSISEQRNFVYPKIRDFENEEDYNIAKKEAFEFFNIDHRTQGEDNIVSYFPVYHVFGHVTTKEIFGHLGYIGIDTACADGGALSCVMFYHDIVDIHFSSYQSRKSKIQNLSETLTQII